MTHNLKIWSENFELIRSGIKTFEVRKNDRKYRAGDTLVLKEFSPHTFMYSGEKIKVKVTHILYGGQFGIEEGYVVMSIKKYESQKS